MGLFGWMGKGSGKRDTRFSVSPKPQVPTFEQLEPRVLLSADACLVPDYQLLETPEEQVISVDVDAVTSGVVEIAVDGQQE